MTTLSINDSTTPILRAGSSNLVWPVIAIALVILVTAQELPTSGRTAMTAYSLATIMLGLRLFYTTVARIAFSESTQDVMFAIGERRIPYEHISSVEIVRLQLTPLLQNRIRCKDSSARIGLAIRGPMTGWGTLKESGAKILELLLQKGVNAIFR